MTSLRPTSPKRVRALRVAATAVAGLLALLLVNNLQSDSNAVDTNLATSGVFGFAGDAEQPQTDTTAPVATAVPTTAPVLVPTATPAPTATEVPTPAPTATTIPPTPIPATPVPATPNPATPAPTSPPAPQPVDGEISVADAGAIATPPAPTPEPTATEAAPTAEPTPTADPNFGFEPLDAPTVEAEPTPSPAPTPTPTPVASTADMENYVLGEINQVRANAGLGPVALDPAISNISRDWSQQMAIGGFFDHRPGSQLNVMLPAGWRRWGENIASAPDIFYAQSSLEASIGHYENMVGPFTHVGIGVFARNGQVWVTQNFAQY